ncbi:MAG: hypothetical protein ABH952_11000 [Candidatus Omnitrophota bacterium]
MRQGKAIGIIMPKRYLLIITLFICLGYFSSSCYADDFNISVVPVLRTNTINFGTINPDDLPQDQEVNITVTNTTGARYQIIQTAADLLRSNTGRVIDRDNFVVFTNEGRNGTLEATMPTPVTDSMILYTSDHRGSSDTILAVYSLPFQTLPIAGIYFTTLTYTLEPINAIGISAKSVTISVIMEITPHAEIEVQVLDGSTRLNFSQIGADTQYQSSQEVRLEITNNLDRPYQVTQYILSNFQNSMGDSITNDNFLFTSLSCGKGTIMHTTPDALSNTPVVIYQSSNEGGSDYIILLYTLALPQSQPAGLYSATLKFLLQTDDLVPSSDTTALLQAEVEIPTIFNLEIISTGLDFGRFSADTREQIRSAEIRAVTNLGKQYHVSQTVTRKLMNVEGQKLPEESFSMWTVGGELGTTKVPIPQTVPEGEFVLYISSPEGEEDTFQVNYKLKLPIDVAGGDYTSEIIYTMSSL